MSTKKPFDRSAFKATKVSALKKEEEEVKKATDFKKNGIDFLKLREGKQKVRIYPAHPDTKSFMYAKTVHFVEMADTDKDGKVKKDDNGNVIYRRKPIFNAKVHGVFPKGVEPVDIFDEYIRRVYVQAGEQFQDDNERKKYLSVMTFYKTGITASTKWVMYADLYDDNGIPKFGQLEVPTTVKDSINEISANQDDDGLLQVDPFTDPDDGRAIFITYDSQETDFKKKYTSAIDYKKPTPLSDEQLQKFMKQDPLEGKFKNAYKHSDFVKAVEGLKRFDEQSEQALRAKGFEGGYDIFAQEDFLDICEKMSEYFPETAEDVGTAARNSFVDGVDDDLSSDSPFDATEVALEDMDVDQLADYISEKGLDITILPEDSEEDIIQAIRDEEALSDESEQEEEVVEEEPAPTRRRRGGRASQLD